MDKQYWIEIGERAEAIPDEFPLVVSLNTKNGGKAGCIVEVDRHTAAKLLVDGTHLLATEEQAAAWIEARSAKIDTGKRAAAARRLQVEVIERNLAGLSTMTEPPLATPASDAKPKK